MISDDFKTISSSFYLEETTHQDTQFSQVLPDFKLDRVHQEVVDDEHAELLSTREWWASAVGAIVSDEEIVPGWLKVFRVDTYSWPRALQCTQQLAVPCSCLPLPNNSSNNHNHNRNKQQQ